MHDNLRCRGRPGEQPIYLINHIPLGRLIDGTSFAVDLSYEERA